MQELLTEETPGKVMGLVGVALFSMAILFGVSMSNASFQGAEYALPNPFAPQKVVSVVDTGVQSYANALAGFLEPARQAIALHVSEMQWIVSEASPSIARAMGAGSHPKAQVAGAFTKASKVSFKVSGPTGSLNVDSLYALVIGY
ncbi:MAG: hypothetical protein HYZ51_00985 [Candidatus Doudnabacteria bacterium]|nr:hypothetical protein [Candidatus Doudnabacteria bacterium]